MAKKLTAVVLALAVIMSAFAIPAYAATEVTSEVERGFYRFVDGVLDTLVNGIAALIFEPRGWDTKANYETENFYEGYSAEEFLDTPADGAVWSVGYSNASILTGKELEEEHYVGGSLSITKKLATYQYDDQKIRTVAISDGRGISIFASADTFGLANNEVRLIREMFQEVADANGWKITSINISSLHQHSCVDTLGLNGDLVGALFTSSIKNLLGIELSSGKTPSYMENFRAVAVKTMEEAVRDMKQGNLYFGTIDISELIRDKRVPTVFDGNLNRFRFVPADGSRETWLVNLPIHCVGNGAAGTELTADYPYYMEKYIDEMANANFSMILGAELAVSSEYPEPLEVDPAILAEHNDEGYARLAAFGKILAEKACAISNDVAVAPILNIRFTEIFVPVKNSIFRLAAKGGLLTNAVVKNGLDYEAVSEVGYAEFGTAVAVALIPGELAPEIAYGGAISAEDSWLGTTWNYTYFQDATDRDLIVFGVTNDQLGYMLTQNDWRSYLTENEEIVSTGPDAGAYIAEAYLELFNEVN